MPESRSVMDSAGDNFKKVIHNDTNENVGNYDKVSECSNSEKIVFIPTKEDEETGSTSDSDDEDDTSDKAEGAVMQMLKEGEDREKEVKDQHYRNTYSILTTEEVTQQASQTEGKDLRVLQHKPGSQRCGEDLLLAYACVNSFYCSVLPFGSFVTN